MSMSKVKVAKVKPTIKYSDFEKLDIRVGTIEKVVDMEKSDKLIKLVVDFGDHKRNIIVGMKKEREDRISNIEQGMMKGVICRRGFSAVDGSDILATSSADISNGCRKLQ